MLAPQLACEAGRAQRAGAEVERSKLQCQGSAGTSPGTPLCPRRMAVPLGLAPDLCSIYSCTASHLLHSPHLQGWCCPAQGRKERAVCVHPRDLHATQACTTGHQALALAGGAPQELFHGLVPGPLSEVFVLSPVQVEEMPWGSSLPVPVPSPQALTRPCSPFPRVKGTLHSQPAQGRRGGRMPCPKPAPPG